MTEQEKKDLRAEKCAFLIGTMLGQISELLNYMKRDSSNINIAYESLCDISNMAAIQVHELYYKGTKP